MPMQTQSDYVHLQRAQFFTNSGSRTISQVASQVRGAPRKTQLARNITALPCSEGSSGQSCEPMTSTTSGPKRSRRYTFWGKRGNAYFW